MAAIPSTILQPVSRRSVLPPVARPTFGTQAPKLPLVGKATIYDKLTNAPVEGEMTHPEEGRFEMRVGGKRVGTLDLALRKGYLFDLFPVHRLNTLLITYMQSKHDPAGKDYKGVGTALHEFALEVSRRLGCPGRIRLNALEKAVGFHLKRGFTLLWPDFQGSTLPMIMDKGYARQKLAQLDGKTLLTPGVELHLQKRRY